MPVTTMKRTYSRDVLPITKGAPTCIYKQTIANEAVGDLHASVSSYDDNERFARGLEATCLLALYDANSLDLQYY